MQNNWIRTNLWMVALVLASLVPLASRAAGVSESTTITDLTISKQYGNFVFIRTAGPLTGPASCSTNGHWHFTLSLANPGDREIYAMVLSAFQAGTTVTLVGTGDCNEFGTIESMRSINVKR